MTEKTAKTYDGAVVLARLSEALHPGRGVSAPEVRAIWERVRREAVRHYCSSRGIPCGADPRDPSIDVVTVRGSSTRPITCDACRRMLDLPTLPPETIP